MRVLVAVVLVVAAGAAAAALVRPAHLHIACISLLASLCARPSAFEGPTLLGTIPSASNPLDPVPLQPWPGGMREAIK